jgi:hypothetical protein
VQPRGRIREHRAARLAAIELPAIDLGHVRDERRVDLPSTRRQLIGPAKQLLIGKSLDTRLRDIAMTTAMTPRSMIDPMRSALALVVGTACTVARSPSPPPPSVSVRAAPTATNRSPGVSWRVLSGPYVTLRRFDVEAATVGPRLRLVRLIAPDARTSCTLAIQTPSGWYVDRDPLGPCDPLTDLGGDTQVVDRTWRDASDRTGDDLLLDVVTTDSIQEMRTGSAVVVGQRTVRTKVRCVTRSQPPRCTAPEIDRIDDRPRDQVRAWLLDPR